MLVMLRVLFTLLGADATRLNARLDNRASQLRHEPGLPAQDPAGCEADVAAVLTQRYAAQQRRDIRLGAGSIATGGAALRTVEARVDARDERTGCDLNRPWIRLQHLPSMAHHVTSVRLCPMLVASQARVANGRTGGLRDGSHAIGGCTDSAAARP